MKKIRSLYHNPKGERGIGKWIVGWTWVLGLLYDWKVLKYNYSHESLWFPDEDGDFDCLNRGDICAELNSKSVRFLGQCFSSTTRGGAKGVRFAPASEVLKHPERWEYIEFEVSDYEYEKLIERAWRRVGLKYDFLAVATGFISPIAWQDEQRWYCSEICCYLKYGAQVISKLWKRISPRRSAYIMAKKYHEPKPI